MNKKIKFSLVVLVLLIIAAFMVVKSRIKTDSGETIEEISPVLGSIQNIISTTGAVLPKNRLEIKPPVGGRVESILVKEGENVKTGQILAWMSSTERAALLDAALGQGEEKLKYWQEAYKAIALLAPIDGEVIVATTQPGQTVTISDAVIVLSDHLIARAQVDETDIGKIRLNQKAIINLDAYPEIKINTTVEHIYYESKIVNNVTIYEVDLIPEEVPEFFRSGMNVTVNFIEKSKDDVLLLPLEAVHKDREGDFVLIKQNAGREPLRRPVTLGISDEKNAEIVSGLEKNDKVILRTKKFSLPKSTAANSPFTPFRQRRVR